MCFTLRKFWGVAGFLFCSSVLAGDGEYKARGIWPFVDYQYELPEFELKSNHEISFRVEGFKSHGTSHMTVLLESDEPKKFQNLETVLELRVSGKNNVTYFYRKAQLNGHYLRMVREGRNATIASEFEWNGRYRYSSGEVNAQIVPFSMEMEPIDTTTMEYIQSLPTGIKDYYMTINVGSVQTEFENVTAEIKLVSGWK